MGCLNGVSPLNSYLITQNHSIFIHQTNIYRYVSVGVNQTPVYNSYSPVGEQKWSEWTGSSAGCTASYQVRSNPTVSKSGNVIYVTIPSRVILYARTGGYTANKDFDITVAMTI